MHELLADALRRKSILADEKPTVDENQSTDASATDQPIAPVKDSDE